MRRIENLKPNMKPSTNPPQLTIRSLGGPFSTLGSGGSLPGMNRLSRLAPIATGASTLALSALAGAPVVLSLGAASVGMVAGVFAFRSGRSAFGSHLAAASVGVLAGSLIREAFSMRLKDGFTWTGTLRNASSPDLPQSALVHAPPGFDPSKPFGVFVYFRGWNSCVPVLAGSSPAPCAPGGRTRTASDLIGQVDRSGANVLLVMPEWVIERESSSPGALARTGGFRAMLDEVMADVLSPRVGRPVRLEDASRIVLAAHSGGNAPLAVALRTGGLPRADDVLLLDALYGDEATFVAHARAGHPIASLFTEGTTERRSRSLASSLGAPVEESGQPPTVAEWRRPVLVARTSTAHSFIPLRNVEAWLKTRDLPSR